MKANLNTYRLLIIITGAFFFFPFLGSTPLFDWDEINFAESAREMIVSGDYGRVQINFQPFWEKPPLFFWMQVLSMKIFGINEYAARFPNAVCGIITLLLLFEFGRKLRDEKFGLMWALTYLGSFLPHIYFKSGIIDPFFNLFIFCAIYFMAKSAHLYNKSNAAKYVLMAGIFSGLAILTKGPVAVLLIGLTFLIVWANMRFKKIVSFKHLLLYGFSTLLISLAWFGYELIKNGPWFINEFIEYQIRLAKGTEAGHNQPFYYHFIVVFAGCFPMAQLSLQNLFTRNKTVFYISSFEVWMKCLFWVVLIVFSLVKTKIIHYSSLTYLPLSFFAALTFYDASINQQKIKKYIVNLITLIVSLFALAFGLLPLVGKNINVIKPYIKDPFAQENMNAEVNWSILDALPAVFLISALTLFLIYRNKSIAQSMFYLYTGVALSIMLFLILVPAKIEKYTQHAAVEFFSGLKGKDVYVETLSYKSYAHYFYFARPPLSKQEIINAKDENGLYSSQKLRDWYLSGQIDKPVYFSVKNIYLHEYESYKKLKLLYKKNGFAFLVREPDK